jgi:hypothetical protein
MVKLACQLDELRIRAADGAHQHRKLMVGDA